MTIQDLRKQPGAEAYASMPDDMLRSKFNAKYPGVLTDAPSVNTYSPSGNQANDVLNDIRNNQGKGVANIKSYYGAQETNPTVKTYGQPTSQPSASMKTAQTPQGGFDRAAAKAAGYTDQEIDAFLSKKSPVATQAKVASSIQKNTTPAKKSNPIAKAAGAVGNFLIPQTMKNYQQALDVFHDPNKYKNNPELVKKTQQDIKGRTGKSALELGSFLVPAGKGVKGLMVAGGVVGAMRGASEDNPTLPSIGASAAGGVVGGALIGGAEKVLRGLTKGIPEKIMNAVFKEPLKDTRAAVKGGQTLGQQALKRGVKGSEEEVMDQATNAIGYLDDNLQNALFASKERVSTEGVRQSIKPLVNSYIDSGNTAAAQKLLSRVDAIEKAAGKSMPVARANEIKRSLYDEASKAYGTEASAQMEGIKAIARNLKEQIAKVPGVSEINKDLSFYGRARDAMVDKLARGGRNSAFGLSDIGISGAGGIMGTIAGGLPGGIAGAAVSEIAKKGLGSTAGGTAIANTLNKMGQKGLPPIVGQGIKKGAPILGSKVGSVVKGIPQGVDEPSDTYPSENGNNPVHMPNGTLPSIEAQPQYTTGQSPSYWNDQYQQAMQAGDEATAKYALNQRDLELSQQKSGGAAKKNAKQQSFANAANAGQKALSLLESGGVQSGIGQNIIGGIGEKTGWNSAKQTDYRSTVGLARTLARNALLGANMTPRELESLSAAIPEFDDAPNIAKQKLRTFVQLMNQFSANFEGVPAELTLPDIEQ